MTLKLEGWILTAMFTVTSYNNFLYSYLVYVVKGQCKTNKYKELETHGA